MNKIIIVLISILSFTANSQDIDFGKITSKYQDTVSQQKFGIVTLVKHNEELTLNAIGWASDSLQMTTDKVFNIGSLTKMFTSLLVMQEIENGNLKLTDEIGQFFPKNKNVDPKISIEQLLKHRTGLGEIVVDKIINRASMDYFNEYNSSNLYDKIPKPISSKGKIYEYTNTNYILLGYILEILNDLPYSQILEERIFKVCNMNNSYGYFSKSIKNSAHPMYNGEDLNEQINFKFYKNYTFSAGGIASNVNDLERFFTSLYESDNLISRETFTKMTTFTDGYGYGIEEYNAKSDKGNYILIGHGGDNLSFKVRNYYNPETRNLVIVIANEFGVKEVSKIANELLQALEK